VCNVEQRGLGKFGYLVQKKGREADFSEQDAPRKGSVTVDTEIFKEPVISTENAQKTVHALFV
jgi:hypothetical protein